MTLRDVLADLDISIKGQGSLARANAQVDAFSQGIRRAQPRARVLGGNIQQITRNAGAAAPAASTLTSGVTALGTGFLAAGAAAVGIAGAILHATSSVREFLGEIISMGDDLGDTSDRLGISSDALQTWRFVAERSGSSAEAMDRSIGVLNRNLGAAALRGGRAAEGFRALHVAVRDANGEIRPTGDVLGDTLRALSRISNPVERAARAQALFGRSGASMAQIAGQGEEAISALVARQRELGGGLSEDLVEGAGDADNALIDFRLALTSLKSALAVDVLPVLASAISSFATFVGWVSDALRHSTLLETGLIALGVAIGALVLASLPLTLPILLAAAAFAFLLLAVDDVVTAFQGGESIFGEWVEGLAAAMGITLDFTGIVELFGMAWEEVLVTVQEAGAGILEQAAALQNALGIEIAPGVEQAAGRARAGATNARASFSARTQTAVAASRDRLRDRERENEARTIQEGGTAKTLIPRSGRGGSRVTNRTRVHAPITINGARDEQLVAREVESVMRRREREALEDLPLAEDEAD